MEATQSRTVNGVDVRQLKETIMAVKGEPTLAKCIFRARNKWHDGAFSRAEVKDFFAAGQEDDSRDMPFVFDLDEPPVLLGENRGTNPVEYVLVALSGCLTTSMIYHAAARNIPVEEIESYYEGDLDLHGFLGISDDVRNGYDNIRITFKVKGDLTEEQKAEVVAMGQQFSPVFDVVTNPVPVTVECMSM